MGADRRQQSDTDHVRQKAAAKMDVASPINPFPPPGNGVHARPRDGGAVRGPHGPRGDSLNPLHTASSRDHRDQA
jgi:hypothetical protein